jgi:hypothetical protein
MATERKGGRTRTERKSERTGTERVDRAEERIEKQRGADKATEAREDEGYDQPESSAQKGYEPEPEP